MEHPFRYPLARGRLHGTAGYRDYGSYRPWLRDEFAFRCGYCLLREQWGRVRGTFDIDHFEPTALSPRRRADYDNLVYACAACNSAKSDRAVPDPLGAFTGPDVWVEDDGTMHADTTDARILIDTLGLNDEDMREIRSLWIGIVVLAFRGNRALYERLMAYPNDLPDLRRLKPPGGNRKPDGIEQSHLVRRELGLLPATY